MVVKYSNLRTEADRRTEVRKARDCTHILAAKDYISLTHRGDGMEEEGRTRDHAPRGCMDHQ